MFFTPISRDNLDEKGSNDQSLKRAAGSDGMIVASLRFRKHFLDVAFFDCRS
jgi:hypothetical protein